MKSMKRLALAVLLTVLGPARPLLAADLQVANVLYNYDADSTTPTSCVLIGRNSTPLNSPMITGPKRVKTTGSSTTVSAVTALDAPFLNVSAKDVVAFPRPAGTTDLRVVNAKADSDTITVDSAINLDATAGFPFLYYRTVCGTTDADGWVGVGGASRISMTIQYEQGDADNISWQFQCRQAALGSAPVVVYPGEGDNCGPGGTLASNFCDFATPGATARFTWQETRPFAACRIVFKVKTTDTSEAGTNLERVVASIVVAGDF